MLYASSLKLISSVYPSLCSIEPGPLDEDEDDASARDGLIIFQYFVYGTRGLSTKAVRPKDLIRIITETRLEHSCFIKRKGLTCKRKVAVLMGHMYDMKRKYFQKESIS
jgi:hypothetical protein